MSREPTVKSEFDPVTLEVIRNAVRSTAEEMGTVLRRTAYSTNIKDRMDFSCAVYTADGQTLAQAEHIPLHLGLMTDSVKTALAGVGELEPGDSVMHNDPYVSGSHLYDVMVFTPVFHDGERIAVVGNLAHHVDVGGAGPAKKSDISEIFEEGIRFPPVKIRKNGELDEELVEVFLHNLRTRDVSSGDFSAQVGSTLKGESNVLEITEKYGPGTFTEYMDAILDYSEKRIRQSTRELPNGTGSFTDYIETKAPLSDADEIPITVEVEIADDEILVDFAGSSEQVRGPLNAARPLTLSCVYYVVKAVVDPSLPTNDGAYRPIRVHTPEGSIVNAEFPAPTQMANSLTCQRIADALLGAFEEIVPERVMAGCTGSMNAFGIIGQQPDSEEMYSYVETYGGGQGAKFDDDGMDGIHTNMTNTRNAPVEVLENTYPFEINRYQLVENSEGAGRFRGGMGMTREIEVTEDAAVSINTARMEHRPWGVDGGEDAHGSEVDIVDPDGARESVDTTFVNREIPANTRIQFRTAGGGGWGSPLDRAPEAVARDVRAGLVSESRAKDVYGVVLKDDGTVNRDATGSLRADRRDRQD
jgi:N-methylhydantoinase B